MANESLDPDQAARELGRANRRPLLIAVGVIAAAAIGVVVYLKMGESAARDSLLAKGYTELRLSSTGLTSWTFEGTKGTAKCFGTITRTPGSTSSSEACTDVTPAASKRTSREQVERSLSKKYAKHGFDTFTCPDIAAQQDTVTCKIAATNGATMDVENTRTELDDDGTWAKWEIKAPYHVDTSARLVEMLTPLVTKAARDVHPEATVTVDCGTGPIILVNDRATCSATLHHPDKVLPIAITSEDGSMNWHIDGL